MEVRGGATPKDSTAKTPARWRTNFTNFLLVAARVQARKSLMWVAGVFLAAISGVLVAILTAIPRQALDAKAAGDLIRTGDEIRIVGELVNDDGKFSLAFPGIHTVDRGEPALREASIQNILRLMKT